MIKTSFVHFLLAAFIVLSTSCSQLQRPELQKNVFTVKWAKNLDPIYDSGNLPIGTSSPLVHEDLIYIGSLNGQMNAYDLSTGRSVWSQNEGRPLSAEASYFKEYVYYGGVDGRLFSRHYLTGEMNFAVDLGHPIDSAPVFHQGRMFVHLRNHSMIALDAHTGKILWDYKRSIPYSTTLQRVSKALPYKNTIIVGFADGSVGAISIEEGIIKWEQKITNAFKFLDVDVDPILFDGKVVVGSAAGPLHFLNPETGMVERTVAITIGHSPQVTTFGQLLVGTVFGEAVLLKRDGSIIDKKKITDKGIGSMVQWKNHYVAATMDGRLIALDNELNVEETWLFGSKISAVFGKLQVKDALLSVYSSRNRLYIFR